MSAADNLLRRFQAILAGQYTIERELGRGGMATVYLAKDLRHDRPVAIKLLQPELTTAATAERFLREIAITAKLQHPHILTLIDSGARDGLVYYVMPHVDGESLRDRLIWERQCNIEAAIQVARQVATALQYAHERGVVHRDIKPENILISAGQAMIADFGIARAIRDSNQQSITAVGMPLGTPAYMSPEQAAGLDKVDPRSDIYSLGCVLFEMLAGRPPFVATTVTKVLQMHLTEPPPAVSTCRSAAPQQLDEILTRALAKDPAERFQTARELADALSLIEAAETLERATPTGARRKITPASLEPVSLEPPAAPHRRLLVASGIVAAAVIGAILIRGTGGAATPGPAPAAVQAEPAYLASIGVKPLDPIGNDSGAATLSAGITEEISAQLSKIRQLKVISRTTMEVAADRGWTAKQAADSLGIRYLLEGSVQRSGRDLGVTLQLIDAQADAHVWGETYRMPAKDILMLRQDIARKVVTALAGRVSGLRAMGADSGSRNPEAVAARARGLELLNRGDEAMADEAIKLFEQALALDSAYAQAAAELSEALGYYVNLGFGTRRDPYRTQAEAIRWGNRAVELDSMLAMAWAARGAARLASGATTSAALADLDRAVALAPGSGPILVSRGIARARTGRYREALNDLERAAELDPLNPTTRGGGLALTALAARRYAQAAAEAKMAASQDPRFPGWPVIEGLAYLLDGEPRKCLDLKLRALGVPVTAICLHHAGDSAGGARIIDSLVTQANSSSIGIYTMGFVGAYHANLGHAAEALVWLNRAYDASPRAFDTRLLDSGLFDPVLGDTTFRAGLAAIWTRVQGRFPLN